MMTPAQIMAALTALTPEVAIKYSDYTGRFYVSAPIDISDGGGYGGVAKHEASADIAIHAFWATVTGIKSTEHLRVRRGDRTWRGRWNGFMWKEQDNA